jgi:hypothetical protein
MPKNEIALPQELAISQRVRLRLWQAHGINRALGFISSKRVFTPLRHPFMLDLL